MYRLLKLQHMGSAVVAPEHRLSSCGYTGVAAPGHAGSFPVRDQTSIGRHILTAKPSGKPSSYSLKERSRCPFYLWTSVDIRK